MSLLLISSMLSLTAMSLPYIKLNISSDDELFNFFLLDEFMWDIINLISSWVKLSNEVFFSTKITWSWQKKGFYV